MFLTGFYFVLRTIVEGRVIRKTEMLTYSNGTGRFFVFDLADLSAAIRCTVFNDVANMFIEQIAVGNVCYLNKYILIILFMCLRRFTV